MAERYDIRRRMHQGYRTDIDGLRAVAVVPVVLNHVGMPGVWGGYVGVDIFFVISGYLITGIIVRDLAIGRHTISEFYRRRVLRIFPALFVMLFGTTLIACLTMLPGELVRYARSLAATTVFGSNMLFYAETGYFEPGARLKPLLHTWSLAIEEQFYIVWPLLLAAVVVSRPYRLKAAVVGTTVVSFCIALWQVEMAPTAAFYLLPARAWELGLGSALALATAPRWPRWVNELFAAAGLLLVFVAVRRFTEQTAFPGLAAALPCAGAALMIATGHTGTVVGKVLSLRPIRFIGMISYSLYLWHWPVIVFSELGLLLPRSGPVMAAQVAVSLILAIASWRFVERPFRTGGAQWSTRWVLGFALAALAAALALAGGLAASGGLAGRFTPAERAVMAYADMDGDALYREGTCFDTGERRFDAALCLRALPDKPVVLLVGDSHAAHYWPGLARHTDRYSILQATRTGCKPLLYPAGAGGACEAFFRTMLSRGISTDRPDLLLISARWIPSDLPLLERTLTDPHVRAANLVLIGPVPRYVTALPRLLVRRARSGDADLVHRSRDPVAFTTDRAMKALAKRVGVPYVSTIDMLCRREHCRTWAEAGVPLQFDYGHLTAEGSAIVVDGILSRIPTIDRPKDRLR